MGETELESLPLLPFSQGVGRPAVVSRALSPSWRSLPRPAVQVAVPVHAMALRVVCMRLPG
eukprot:9033897-Pyramimonas_sp.AAC.1